MKKSKFIDFKIQGRLSVFSLTMASGDVHEVSISSSVTCRYETFTERDEVNCPYYALNPLYLLNRRIDSGKVREGINYGLIESFKEISSEDTDHTVYLKITNKLLGNSFRWYRVKL